jgi:ketosteroid isomerase-like protein
MKATGWLLTVLCALSLSISAQDGQQSNEGGPAAVIRGLEHAWVEGQSRNDNQALEMIFDNDLVYVEYGKLVTKGKYLARIKQASPQLSEIVMEPMTVHTFGSTAIVVGTYRERDRQAGKRTVRRWRFIDTWVFQARGWVLVAAGAAPTTE